MLPQKMQQRVLVLEISFANTQIFFKIQLKITMTYIIWTQVQGPGAAVAPTHQIFADSKLRTLGYIRSFYFSYT